MASEAKGRGFDPRQPRHFPFILVLLLKPTHRFAIGQQDASNSLQQKQISALKAEGHRQPPYAPCLPTRYHARYKIIKTATYSAGKQYADVA